jgi:uncharacterized metal-binding protein YceD (DUF177 family)
MTVALTWDHAAQDIPQDGLTQDREATSEERAALARTLDLLACHSLTASYAITPTGLGRYTVSGSLRAQIEQTCGVTLEPVPDSIAETFNAVFWPPDDVPPPSSGEVGLDDDPEPEPIHAGRIDVGRIVYECLAAAIDPFPRAPGAMFDASASGPAESTGKNPDNPFAVLAKIKREG